MFSCKLVPSNKENIFFSEANQRPHQLCKYKPTINRTNTPEQIYRLIIQKLKQHFFDFGRVECLGGSCSPVIGAIHSRSFACNVRFVSFGSDSRERFPSWKPPPTTMRFGPSTNVCVSFSLHWMEKITLLVRVVFELTNGEIGGKNRGSFSHFSCRNGI